jgi:hypothetical protein
VKIEFDNLQMRKLKICFNAIDYFRGNSKFMNTIVTFLSETAQLRVFESCVR